MKFKERLRCLRKLKGVTQQEVANYLNYGYSAISNYEGGRCEPSISDLIKLANYFGVSVDFLVGNSDTMAKQM